MRQTLLTMALGLATSTTFAAGKQGGSNSSVSEAEIDRTLRFESVYIWFALVRLNLAPGEMFRFEIINTSNPEHDFVIGDASAQEVHRKRMQSMGGIHGDGRERHDMAEGETAVEVCRDYRTWGNLRARVDRSGVRRATGDELL